MILYHFCPEHLKDSILKNGLKFGAYPLVSSNGFVKNVQWLTSEKDADKQSWATSYLIPYSRTAYRLTVDIPKSYHKKLIQAHKYVERFESMDRKLVTDWQGSEEWYVYLGKIPPKWIIGCRKMNDKN